MSMQLIASRVLLTNEAVQLVAADRKRKHLILKFENTLALGGSSTLSSSVVDNAIVVQNGALVFAANDVVVPSPACEAAVFGVSITPTEQNAFVDILEFVDL